MARSKQNILIRADSSFTVGTGHIMRDLVLAKQYPEANITFATQELDGNINHKVLEAEYTLKTLLSNDINELDTLIKKLKIDLLIIDHYGIDHLFEKQLKKQNPSLTVLSLDDTYEKHYCDILLNHNINADAKKYHNLVPSHCKLRCGRKYTLLREEFFREKQKKVTKTNSKFTIFLAMGGADTAKLNIPILKVIQKFSHLNVIVVSTTANKELKTLQNFTKNKKWIQLYINSQNIAMLMKKSDLVICTPSVTVNEALFMELPLLAIKTANNQNEIYKFLKRKRFNTLKKFNRIVLFNLLRIYLGKI